MALALTTLASVTCGNGSALQLTTHMTACFEVIIQAHPDNTDAVWIGDSNVSASGKRGMKLLAPAASTPLPFITDSSPNPLGLSLSEYYTDSASASQKVNVMYR